MKTGRLTAVILALTLLLGIALCVGMRQKRLDREAVLADVSRQSEESHAAWSATDEAKLAIQAQNQALTEEIRELELQTGESAQKIADLQPQIESLEEEKNSLVQRQSGAAARKTAADAEKAELDGKTAQLEQAVSAWQAADQSGDAAAARAAEELLRSLLENREDAE